VFKTKSSDYGKTFYGGLYPGGENLEYYQQRIQELLGAGLENDILIKCLK
jgi:hypothetical protein